MTLITDLINVMNIVKPHGRRSPFTVEDHVPVSATARLNSIFSANENLT